MTRMKRRTTSLIFTTRIALFASLTLAMPAGMTAAAQQVAMPVISVMPALPVTPSTAAGVKVISMQGVVLAESYATDFRSEHPQVSGGWIIVIEADKAVLAPRALAEPLVLASGAKWIDSVEWFNHGFASGHRVCFVPSPVGEKGALARDTEGMRIWFGTPRLPESVDAAVLEQERALADAAKIQPTPPVTTAATVQLANRDALIASARELIAQYAPDEVQSESATPAAPVAPVAPVAK